jgi:hypothetical protein
MNRLFSTTLLQTLDGWTEGPDWEEPNPANSLSTIYHRRYTGEEGENNYRLNQGDNFYIGSPSSSRRDWKPHSCPWECDIEGVLGNEISFFFGLQTGESGIDAKINPDASFIYGVSISVFDLNADYHCYFGLSIKDSGAAIRLRRDITGLTVEGAILINTPLLLDEGHSMIKAVFKHIAIIAAKIKTFFLGTGSTDISIQDMYVRGTGDIGIYCEAGHSAVVIVAVAIVNEDHQYEDTQISYTGIDIGVGGDVVAKDIELQGFSGPSHVFRGRVLATGLISKRCGAGIVAGHNSELRDCMVMWTRQLVDDSFAYFALGDLALINCGVNLDETGALGVVVLSEGSTVTVKGGDYQLRSPLPFATALGAATLVLENVRINNQLYTETIDLGKGDSWRGELSPVTRDLIKIPNNMPVMLPYNHIPELRNAVSVQGSDRPFDSSIALPSGAKIAPLKVGSLKYYADEAFLDLDPGETAIDRLRYSTPENIYIHEFEITANDEVGAKLALTDELSGNSWSRSGASYSAANNNTFLGATVTLEANEIYQISTHVEAISAGTIVPCINGDETVLSDEPQTVIGRRTWLLRAPTNAVSIGIMGQNFTGKVKDTYLRKLIRTEPAATPLIKSLTKTGEATALIEWQIPPVARISDTVTANKTKSGELNSSAKFGYRDTSSSGDFLFTNTYSTAKRSSISIRGGNTCEVYNHNVVGGYPDDGENATWQTGFQNGINNGPYFSRTQICYMTADLKLNSNKGWYGGPTHNSDCIVINGSFNEESMLCRTTLLGGDLKGSSDGVIDCKQYAQYNYSRLEGAYKPLRAHQSGLSIACNLDFIQGEDSRYAIGPTYTRSYVALWNCAIDGIPIESKAKAESIKKTDGHYAGRGQIGEYSSAIHILHSYPTIDDEGRIAATDMEFQIATEGGSWQALEVENTEVHNFRGRVKREVNLSIGTHEIRCRCRNGAAIGSWSNTATLII